MTQRRPGGDPSREASSDLEMRVAKLMRENESLRGQLAERERGDQEQREEESRSLAILESISDAFFALNEDWCFTYVNRQAEVLLVRTRQDLVGKNLWEEYPPALGTEFERIYRRVMMEKIAESVEIFYPPHERWYEVHAYPAPDGICVYFRDANERRRAEETNAKFRAMFEQSTQLFAGILALDGGVVEVNPVALEGCGFLREEVLGQAFWKCGWWNRSADAMELVRKGLEQAAAGNRFRGETRFFHADGSERFIDLALAPVTDEERRVRFVSAIGVDISDRLHAEKQLRESEAQRRLALEAAELGSWNIDISSRVMTCDQRFRALFGVSADHLTYEEAFSMIHPEDRPLVSAAVADAMRPVAPVPYSMEYRVVHGDGSIRWLFAKGRAHFDTTGSVPVPASFDGTVVDITDRRRAGEDLRKSEARLGAALAIAQLGTFTWDVEADFLTLDHRSRDIFGFTEGGRISAEELFKRVTRTDLERVLREVREAIAHSSPLTLEFQIMLPDGTPRFIASIGNFAAEEDGTQRLLGVFEDITERRGLENDLRQLAADLSEADHRKDEFLATLAHELRNPLAPIRNGLQVMRLLAENPEAAEQTRNMMERQLVQLVRLVDDLLDISRITRNTLELRRERLMMSEVISSAVEISRPTIDTGGHTLELIIPPRPIHLDGDLTRLAQVFSNLLNNAAKYTEHGGRLTLTVEEQGSEAVIKVRDTGVGIEPEMLPRVFEMFTQVEGSKERSQGGLGIGLTLVRRLVKMHGGSVEAFSAGSGCGSEFVVTLPTIALSESSLELDQPVLETTKTAAQRILVVDDNRDSAMSLSKLLRLKGHEVQTVHDGLEALASATDFLPEIVLLDIGLPHLNGWEVATAIRKAAWGRDMILIALTGWGQDDDQSRSTVAGFNAHLVKPVDFAVLMKLMATLVTTAPEVSNA